MRPQPPRSRSKIQHQDQRYEQRDPKLTRITAASFQPQEAEARFIRVRDTVEAMQDLLIWLKIEGTIEIDNKKVLANTLKARCDHG